MTTNLLKALDPKMLVQDRSVELDSTTLSVARGIIADIKRNPCRLEHYAETLDGWNPESPLRLRRAALEREYQQLDKETRALLDRVHDRIDAFAKAQRECLTDLELTIAGGQAGHRFVPHEVAGCYAPGGRFSLPSSVLMTVVPAKVAGVKEVWVASPNPGPLVLAAAYRAGADGVLAIGGAQAIGAMAFGIGPSPRCDVIVGPGNRYVTAAKHLVRDRVAIDMLAGPSELLILADGDADPDLIACDLLAQAEHDVDAWPVLLTTDAALMDRVQARLAFRLAQLDTKDTAKAALARGGHLVVDSTAEMIALSESIAPEHLQVMTKDPGKVASRLSRYGALFIGQASAEVMADYGAGPNHVLPTGGSARTRGGLSVLDFMSLRTWMRLGAGAPGFGLAVQDSERLAELEGLSGHALAARVRTDASHGDVP